MVFLEHPGDEGDFAGYVEVVRAVFGAGFEGVLAEFAVGSDGGDEDVGLFGEVGEVGVGESADFNGRLEAVGLQGFALGNQFLELGVCAAGDGPFEVGRQVRGDVLRRVLAGVAWASLVFV